MITAVLTIKNDMARGTNFVNHHTFHKMLYKVIRFFKNLGNMAAEQALCYDFEDIVLRSDEYLDSQSEKLRRDPQE